MPSHRDVPYRARMENAIKRFFTFATADVQIFTSVGRWRGLNAHETNKICTQENAPLFEDRLRYSSALIEENTPGPRLCLQNTCPEGHGVGKIKKDEGNSMWDWIPSSKIFSLSTCRFGISPIFNYVYQKPHLHVNSDVFISVRLYVHAAIYLHPTQKSIHSFESLEMLTKTQHYPSRMQISSSLELNDASAE